MGPNSLPEGQADLAERLGFGCAMVSMLLIVLLFPCFRSDTSVCSWCNSQGMLTVFHKLTVCLRLSDSCMGTAGLVSGHETAKCRTNDVASHQKGCQGSCWPG